MSAKFEHLRIDFEDIECREGGWSRRTTKCGTVADLLKIWDIDDVDETSEMAQVLRHLRWAMGRIEELEKNETRDN